MVAGLPPSFHRTGRLERETGGSYHGAGFGEMGGTYPLGSCTGSSTRGRRIDCGIYAGELSSGYAACFSGEALRTTISLATSSSD